MSTSAVIKVEGVNKVCFYKHYDGNKESTMPWLKWFNEDFVANRGDDPEYKFAQLVRSSIKDAEEFGLDDSRYTGWGILSLVDFKIPRDIKYVYTLKKDGSVTLRMNNN